MQPLSNQISGPTDAPLFPFWVADRGLSFFLAFLVLITIFVPMIRLSRPGRIGLDLIFAFMLFSGAVATIRQKALMYLVVAVTVLEFAGDLIVEFNSSFAHLGWDTALKVSGVAWAFGYKPLMERRPDAIHFQSSIAWKSNWSTDPFDLLQLRHACQRELW